MTDVIEDLIEDSGQPLTQDANGYQHTRTFTVRGVTGTAEQKIYNAINDVAIPDYGEAHPVISGLIVTRKSAKPFGRNSSIFKVTCEYSVPANGELADENSAAVGTILSISFDSKLGDFETSIDKDGNIITDDNSRVRTVKIASAATLIRFSRVASGLDMVNLRSLLNHTNSLPWNGDPPRTWRIIDIKSSLITGREDGAYRQDFTLEYRERTWVYEVRGYLNGFLWYVNSYLYPEADFSPLGLTIT